MNSLHPAIKVIWRLESLAGFVFGVAVLAAAVHWTPLADHGLIVRIAACALAAELAWGQLLGVPIKYANYRYALTGDSVQISHGRFIRTHTVIPLQQILYVSDLQGPVVKKLGLTTLRLVLPGGHVEVKGLSTREATTMQSAISRHAGTESRTPGDEP